ncbi:unnamed protein product [Mesocestoides corti]|uniref:Dynein regulatory complex subunit 4 n=2 Tax=Mesocestoides corti TaxID=53468 RepID=A0A0R3UNR8_MESCO|nr:unnamed protein product [Mesocestoides corti]
MTKEEIEKYVVLLRDELDRERTERNMLALERDKISTFWEVGKKQLEDARNLLRKKERELEETEERHQMEMRIYRQKVKHILFEQNAKQSDVKRETAVTLNAMADETRVEVQELHDENYTLKAQMRFRQLESEEAIKMLKRQHETEMTELRQEFIKQAEEMEQRAAKQAAELREELETKRVSEIHATEERKNIHIKQLEMAHDKAFNGMKSYYNDITLGNVNVIKTLKENIEELRSNLVRMQRDLEASLAETAEYKKKLEESEELNKNLRKVAQLYEAEKFAHTAEAQRKRLNDEMESTLLEIKQKAGLRSAILERKLGHLVTIMEAKETELHTLIMAMNADPAAVQESRKHLEVSVLTWLTVIHPSCSPIGRAGCSWSAMLKCPFSHLITTSWHRGVDLVVYLWRALDFRPLELLCKKNTAIKELQYEVSRMAKAYVDLWGACQQKLVEELSHPVNLGIQPLNANPSLISPFNTATAEAKLLNLTSKHPGTASAVIKGKGPLGLTSIPPL